MNRNRIFGAVAIPIVLLIVGVAYILWGRGVQQTPNVDTTLRKETKEQGNNFSKKLGEWPSIGSEELSELNISPEELYEVRFDETLNHYIVWRPHQWEDEPKPLFLNGVRMPHNVVVDYAFSKDGKKFAYGVRENHENFVVFEDREGKRYDNIVSPLFFLEDGTLLYAVEDSGESFIVKNEVEALVDGKFWGSEIMNDHIMYRVLGGKKQSTLFLDGEEVDKERLVDIVKMTPDGKHILYGYSGHFDYSGDEFGYIMYDGMEYRYDRIVDFMVHDDGRFAFVAYDNELKKGFLVVNGKEQRDRLCDATFILQFDTKGGIAYLCMNELPEIPYNPLVWSGSSIPPRTLLNYSLIWNGKEVYSIADKMAQDGLSWDKVDSHWNVTFNKDSTSIAFAITVDHLIYNSTKTDSEKSLVVIDGVVQAEHARRGKTIESISFLGFSTDNTLVYTIFETFKPDRGDRIFIGGNETKWKGYLISAGPFFLDDGRVVAIARETDGKAYYVVIDGKVKSSYEKIFSNSVSLQDEKLVFGARIGGEVWRIVEKLE